MGSGETVLLAHTPHFSTPHLVKWGNRDQSTGMNQLKIAQLCEGVVAIRSNSADLISESRMLFEQKRYARSFALAYFACEENGKIPMLLTAAIQMIMKDKVDWKSLTKDFLNHDAKAKQFLMSAAGALMFNKAKDGGVVTQKDFIEAQMKAKLFSKAVFEQRNSALYVDQISGGFIMPSNAYTKEDAERAYDTAMLLQLYTEEQWGSDAKGIEEDLRELARGDPKRDLADTMKIVEQIQQEARERTQSSSQ